MDTTALAGLRSAALAGMAADLERLGANWSKLAVDRLPLREPSLATLQQQYAELLDALPFSEATEVTPLLQRFARGLRLHRPTLTAGQARFLRAAGLVPPPSGDIEIPLARCLAPDDTWAWLEPMCQSGSLIRHITASSALYLVAHRSLSALRPGAIDGLRDALRTPEVQAGLVNAEGEMRLRALIDTHGAWLAGLARQRELDLA
jgi:hypothetical protein